MKTQTPSQILICETLLLCPLIPGQMHLGSMYWAGHCVLSVIFFKAFAIRNLGVINVYLLN